MPTNELEYHEERNPCGIWLSEHLFKGKTISSVRASTKRIYKEPRTPDDEPVRIQPYMDIHFTDGTYVRVAHCVGGLAEDFGDGRGPQSILSLDFMGVTDYSAYKKTPEEIEADKKKHAEWEENHRREMEEIANRDKHCESPACMAHEMCCHCPCDRCDRADPQGVGRPRPQDDNENSTDYLMRIGRTIEHVAAARHATKALHFLGKTTFTPTGPGWRYSEEDVR